MTWKYDLPNQIYFMRAEFGDRPIKIGVANDPMARAKKIHAMCPFPISLVATVPGNIYDEKLIQRHFRAHRIRGEWFNPAPEILDFISTVQSAGMLPVWAIAQLPRYHCYNKSDWPRLRQEEGSA